MAGRKEGKDKGSGKERHEATLMVGMMGGKGSGIYTDRVIGELNTGWV